MAATATATATSTAKQPNFFELSGGSIKISYSKTSFGGRPTFHYEDGKVTKDFLGDGIRTEKSELGTLVSVTIDITPDRGNTTFTLLVPTVNLRDSQPANVSTQGITTEHKTSIVGPSIPGQTDTYTVQALSGKGEFRVD